MPIAEKTPILWENANVQATWLWLSVWDIYTDQQWTVDGKESFGVHEIVSEFTCLLFNRQLLHIRNLFKKESFVEEEKNHAYSIICSPTQKQGEDDGFSLYVQEIHKSPVLMGI